MSLHAIPVVLDGADMAGVRPIMHLALAVAAEEWHDAGATHVRVTSGFRSKDRGLHGQGLAVDLGAREFSDEIRDRLISRLKRRLPQAFDVVGGPRPGVPYEHRHIHVEWDPKRRDPSLEGDDRWIS